ncbi:Response regulator receiver domain-containing protein [Actinopolyspora mzabensis]|uniref:Response regulator receiver domain-containing protein n=1 Tax=Actinopolyspora mzabensis TaxID=995066 RepID=A0A1G9E909_ACTMZ|nr:response regulator [Actinopolyspora mzabensis]SDK72515.1 Response regulator receiver domain-containing protein [Actinopolyspora mzabensis]
MPELITAIATLLWPLITLLVLLLFRQAIGRVLRTAEKRELEFEVGGQRLTFHELNDQQNEMIQDLQRQLSILSSRLDERETVPVATAPPGRGGDGASTPEEPSGWELDGDPESSELPPVQAPVGPEPFAVLWVTDRAQSHALLVEQLRNNGVRVTITATTSEAVAEVSKRPYRLVVSDMARKEDGQWITDAGLALLRELRDLGMEIPLIVFGTQRGQLQHANRARQLGAVATTSSSYEMFRHFQNFGLL